MKPLMTSLVALIWIGCSCEGNRDIKAGSASPASGETAAAAEESAQPGKAAETKKTAAKTKVSQGGGDIRDGVIPGFDSKKSSR